MDDWDQGEVNDGSARKSPQTEALLATYNTRQLLNLAHNVPDTIRIAELPLARVKRIMKQDACVPQPRMISADTIPLMAYTTQLFIGSLTLLAWQTSTVPGGRNTLQVKDLKAMVAANNRYDFLIDVLDMFDQNQAAENAAAREPLPLPVQHAGQKRSQSMPDMMHPYGDSMSAPTVAQHMAHTTMGMAPHAMRPPNMPLRASMAPHPMPQPAFAFPDTFPIINNQPMNAPMNAPVYGNEHPRQVELYDEDDAFNLGAAVLDAMDHQNLQWANDDGEVHEDADLALYTSNTPSPSTSPKQTCWPAARDCPLLKSTQQTRCDSTNSRLS